MPYKAAPLEGFSTHLEMHEPAARPTLIKALNAMMEVESPVHCDYAIKRMAESQGVARRGLGWSPRAWGQSGSLESAA